MAQSPLKKLETELSRLRALYFTSIYSYTQSAKDIRRQIHTGKLDPKQPLLLDSSDPDSIVANHAYAFLSRTRSQFPRYLRETAHDLVYPRGPAIAQVGWNRFRVASQFHSSFPCGPILSHWPPLTRFRDPISGQKFPKLTRATPCHLCPHCGYNLWRCRTRRTRSRVGIACGLVERRVETRKVEAFRRGLAKAARRSAKTRS